MKAYFVFLFSILPLSSLFAQETTHFEDSQVLISTQQVECIDQANGTAKAYLLIKAQNKLETPIELRFKKNLWFAGACLSCDSESDEYKAKLQLEPNETTIGSCDRNDGLRIFVKMLNLDGVRQLSHFELVDIEITEL